MKRNVGQLMTSEVVSVAPTARFKEIVRVVMDHRISAVPILDEHGGLAGIVSEEDLIQKEADPGAYDDLRVGRVGHATGTLVRHSR